jgi:hypothetical protein
LQTLDRLGSRLLEKQWDDLHHATKKERDENQHNHQKVVGLDLLMREAAAGLMVSHVDIFPQA